MDKAAQTYELWKQTYPRHTIPYGNLAGLYVGMGQHDKALGLAQEALRLAPDSVFSYSILAAAYMGLNRFEEARAVWEKAKAGGIEGVGYHVTVYQIAFVRGDAAAMQREAKWFADSPVNFIGLALQSATAAYAGRLQQARGFSRQAVALMRRGGAIERALKLHDSLQVRPNLTSYERLELYKNLALDYSALGRHDRAVEWALAILKLEKRNTWALRHLVMFYRDLGDWTAGGKYLAQWQKVTNNEDTRLQALCRFRQGYDHRHEEPPETVRQGSPPCASELCDLHIEERRIDSLTPRRRNPRTHSAKQIDRIAASIQEFGFTNPLLIDATGTVIAGHGRLRAAKQLGMATVPAIRLDHLSEEQVRALVIADNKLAELAN